MCEDPRATDSISSSSSTCGMKVMLCSVVSRLRRPEENPAIERLYWYMKQAIVNITLVDNCL